MPDLDYVEVKGRLALTVGDTSVDPDFNTDVQWCDAGAIRFTPLLTSTHVVDATEGPFTTVIDPIEATVGVDGRLTYKGLPSVMLLDLGSSKIDPRIPRDQVAYRVDFLNILSQGQSVSFSSFSFHPLPGQVNDLTLFAPLPTPFW